MTSPTLLLCATEISGDQRGARLARHLGEGAPGLRLYGLGGRRMREAGVDVRLDITDRGTIGWVDHWRDLPAYVSALRFWRREIRDRAPAAAIVIDAPGISLPFARIARSARIPVVYFVTPQTWLWNPRRAVERLRRCADLVVPTLAEEAQIYADAGLPVIYEGHPALDDLAETYGASSEGQGPTSDVGIGDRTPDTGAPQTIGLVPGSRRHAVRRLLPVMLEATDRIEARTTPSRVLVSVATPALRADVARPLGTRRRRGRVGSEPALVEDDLPAVLRASGVVLASTGGNLLEAAFAGTPAVACYRVDALTHAIARHAMRLQGRVRGFALPNLIAGEPIVPEFIQGAMTPTALAEAAVRLLTDRNARERLLAGYRKVRASLGAPGVNERLAAQILARLGYSAGLSPL